jgi:hypothetical protein
MGYLIGPVTYEIAVIIHMMMLIAQVASVTEELRARCTWL